MTWIGSNPQKKASIRTIVTEILANSRLIRWLWRACSWNPRNGAGEMNTQHRCEFASEWDMDVLSIFRKNIQPVKSSSEDIEKLF